MVWTTMSRRLAVLALSLVAACSSYPWAPTLRDPPPGREEVRSVALVFESVPGPPQVQRAVGPLGGVLQGALLGAGVGLTAPGYVLRPVDGDGRVVAFLWIVTAAVTVPICTVGGALAGGFSAMSAEESARRVAIIERAFLAAQSGLGLESALRTAMRRARPEVMAVGSAAADAIVTVRLSGYGLLGGRGFDPEVAVVVEAESTWVAGDVTHRAQWQYRGPTRRLTEWSDGAHHIGAELRRARESLALRIAEELLLVEVSR